MNGYIIYESLISSRRYNKLLQHPIGEFSQLLYILSYTKADFWGHLPFDCEWLKLTVLPGSNRSLNDIKTAMELLLIVRLWDCPYQIDENFYIHIFGFEHWSKGGIRKRMKGQWPDESGVIPHRDLKTPIEECFKAAQYTRETASTYIDILTFPEFSGIFQSIQENYPDFKAISGNLRKSPEISTSTVQYSTVQYYKTGTANAGFLDIFPQIINISGKEIKKTYLQKLLSELKDDFHQLCLVLFRSSTANDPIAWIEKGLKDGYAYEPVKAEYESPMYVQAWIDTLCGITPDKPINQKQKTTRDTNPESISNLIPNLIPKSEEF